MLEATSRPLAAVLCWKPYALLDTPIFMHSWTRLCRGELACNRATRSFILIMTSLLKVANAQENQHSFRAFKLIYGALTEALLKLLN